MEPHIERIVDGDHNLLPIESRKVLVEVPDPLALWFARELFTLCCVGKESDVSVLGLILTGLAVDRVVH